MGDYTRTTRECAPADLAPALIAAIRAHIQSDNLGPVEETTVYCVETRSTKIKKGLFGGKPEVHLTGALLTPRWLVWAVGKEHEKPSVLSAKLSALRVQDYETSNLFKLIQDTGLTITGLATDTPDAGSAFIGLGPEPAAAKFRAMLKEAVAKA